jgi:hypothetical protein
MLLHVVQQARHLVEMHVVAVGELEFALLRLI